MHGLALFDCEQCRWLLGFPAVVENGMDTFGERLRDAMIAQGVSVSALARHMDVSRVTIQTWRHLHEPTMSANHFMIMCDSLHVRARWLAFGKEGMMPIFRQKLPCKVE